MALSVQLERVIPMCAQVQHAGELHTVQEELRIDAIHQRRCTQIVQRDRREPGNDVFFRITYHWQSLAGTRAASPKTSANFPQCHAFHSQTLPC